MKNTESDPETYLKTVHIKEPPEASFQALSLKDCKENLERNFGKNGN